MIKVGLNSDGTAAGAVADAQLAEACGFDYFGCGEHVFAPVPTPNAFVVLAAAAGATSHIRLISSITLLPLYPIALAAKMATTLDVVSGGRFELGIGAGGEFPPEFLATGVDPDTRFRRVDEGLRVLKMLFSGRQEDFAGEFTTLTGVALDPAPLQPGGPPIWVAGRKGGAARRAGRHGSVWLPYLVEPGAVAAGLALARAAAESAGRAPAEVSAGLFIWVCADRDRNWAIRTGISTVSTSYRQDFAANADRWLAVGSPDGVTERLSEYVAAGADHLLVQIAAPPEHRQRVIETLASDVLPSLRRNAALPEIDPRRRIRG